MPKKKKQSESTSTGLIPKFLAKRGITSITDNLQSGDVVNVGRIFLHVFRTEIEARLSQLSPKPSHPEPDKEA